MRRTRDRDPAPIREFADRGVIWLFGRPEHVRDLIALIDAELASSFDWNRAERINRSLISRDLEKQESDVIYLAPYRDRSGEALVYLLLEHQSQPHPAMGYKLLGYMKELWDAFDRNRPKRNRERGGLPPIVPIIFYTGGRRWLLPQTLEVVPNAPDALRRFGLRFEPAVLSLRERPPEAFTGSTVAAALRVLREAEAPTERLRKALSAAIIELERYATGQPASWREVIHFLLLLVRHKRKPAEREALYQIVTESVARPRRTTVRTIIKTDAQELIEQGEAQGIIKGIERGILQGERKTLRRQLEVKFGPLPDDLLARIDQAGEAEFEEMAVKILTAQSFAEFLT